MNSLDWSNWDQDQELRKSQFDKLWGEDNLVKSFGKDLETKFPQGSWKTINGAKVFVNNGNVVAGLDNFNKLIEGSGKKEDVSNLSEKDFERRLKKHSYKNRADIIKFSKQKNVKNIERDLISPIGFAPEGSSKDFWLDDLDIISNIAKEKKSFGILSKIKDMKRNERIKESLDEKGVIEVAMFADKNDLKSVYGKGLTLKGNLSNDDIISQYKAPKEINQKTKSGISIKKQTEKAYLLNKDGVDFWVQKRWFNSDTGKLTPRGKVSFDEKKAQEDKYKGNNTGFEIKRSTEKAHLLEKDGVTFWIPKVWYRDGKLNSKGMQNFEDKKSDKPYKPHNVSGLPSPD